MPSSTTIRCAAAQLCTREIHLSNASRNVRLPCEICNYVILKYDGMSIAPLIITAKEPPPPPTNPCQPSPCGPNAVCQVLSGAPSCSCLPQFIGIPPKCRPECVSNSECPSQQACINQKCRDPCPGSCGKNAECRTVSHTPMCVCAGDFTGDPFIQCNPRPSKCRRRAANDGV